MYAVIDKIEKNIAVLIWDDERKESYSLNDLPPDIREGDCLAGPPWKLDREETEKRRRINEERLNKLFEE
ncbi:MAG: DUF3006 domain-containing protein [Bacillota bacterium]|uniref:DUF3006 family protein n=1 Tax=Thermanaerosceptrum fracticalcis TaxID=1712410 RepID=A0A7G6E393_THEFR|nr:DUF3006 domain-containing protein [Thermanaerosceptrum fracticalcis]QNB46547.1 DUF3006 family protein [Thermanaerosceptrum fracticalcis]